MMESVPPGNLLPATNFTQRDINSSRIFYEHTHPFFGLSTNDSFSFDARADFAEPLLDQVTSEVLCINTLQLGLCLSSQFIRTTVFWKLSLFPSLGNQDGDSKVVFKHYAIKTYGGINIYRIFSNLICT
jgi:hypothetical protein